MIISASYKTDIPTFYGEWFINRLRAGYCKTLNPYGRQVQRVSLKREDVDGLVFWTKNVGPFFSHLLEVQSRGFPFVVQHTVNGYPRALETSVVDAERAAENIGRLADRFGMRSAVWRYDTIVVSSLTPTTFHIENFGRIAQRLRRSTDEVVISFLHQYRKTRRNLDDAAGRIGFRVLEPSLQEKLSLVGELAKIAASNEMKLAVCSQRDFIALGAQEARCVDAVRLEGLGARCAGKARLKGNREQCGCYESRDIGEYDTCPHGCVYCYAVQNRSTALERFRTHNPESEFLFEPPAGSVLETTPARSAEHDADQLGLFKDD